MESLWMGKTLDGKICELFLSARGYYELYLTQDGFRASTTISKKELEKLFESMEKTLGKGEYQAAKWCRAVGPDGELWCESSSEEEVRRSMRPGDRFFRMYQKIESKWVEES